MSHDVVHGRFPFFFYGQPFMGAVDAYLHAVSFILLGESVATLRVWAVLVSLGYVAPRPVWRQRVFTRRALGRGAGARALALSPQVGRPGATGVRARPRSHPAVPAPRFGRGRPAPDRRGRTRALLVLGLVGGIGWWNNLLLAPVLVACLLALALWRPRLRRTAFLPPLTFLLGSAPVWLFAAVYARGATVSVPLAPRRGNPRPCAGPPDERTPPGGGSDPRRPRPCGRSGSRARGSWYLVWSWPSVIVAATSRAAPPRAGDHDLPRDGARHGAGPDTGHRGPALPPAGPGTPARAPRRRPCADGPPPSGVGRTGGGDARPGAGRGVAMAHPELRSRRGLADVTRAFARPAAVADALAGARPHGHVYPRSGGAHLRERWARDGVALLPR